MRRVAHRRPRRFLLHVHGRSLARRRIRCADSGNHPARRRIEEQLVRRNGRSAAANDHVHRSLGGVDHVRSGRRGNRRQRRVRLLTADRVRARVVVLMPADHEVDTVFVEQRHPFLANSQIRAIELIDRRDRDLVHAHHQPVDIAIVAGGGQFLFQPILLSALRIAADVGVAAVLVHDIVVGNADHAH